MLLAEYLALSPKDIEFDFDPGGKPRLSARTIARSVAGDDLHFNLARSGSIAMVAVGRGYAVGVDVERQMRVRDSVLLRGSRAPAGRRICSEYGTLQK